MSPKEEDLILGCSARATFAAGLAIRVCDAWRGGPSPMTWLPVSSDNTSLPLERVFPMSFFLTGKNKGAPGLNKALVPPTFFRLCGLNLLRPP
jgi:hypothetical protein